MRWKRIRGPFRKISPPPYHADEPSLPTYDPASVVPDEDPPRYEVGGWVAPERGHEDAPSPRLDESGATWRNTSDVDAVSRPDSQLNQTDWVNPELPGQSPAGDDPEFRAYDDDLPDDFDTRGIVRQLNDRVDLGQERMEEITEASFMSDPIVRQRITNLLEELGEANPGSSLAVPDPLPAKPEFDSNVELTLGERILQSAEAEMARIEWPVPRETDPAMRRVQVEEELDALHAWMLAKNGENPTAPLEDMLAEVRTQYGSEDVRTKTWEGLLEYIDSLDNVDQRLEMDNDIYMELRAGVSDGIDPRAQLRRMLDASAGDLQQQRYIRDAMAWVEANLDLPIRYQPQVPLFRVPDTPWNVTSSTVTALDLPPDFPRQRVADLLNRQIEALLPDPGEVDMLQEQRTTLANARHRVLGGQNPLPFMDMDIRRLELKQLDGSIAPGEAEELRQMKEVREVFDSFMKSPPEARIAGLEPLPADFDAGAATAQLRARLGGYTDLDDARQALAGVPPPPDLTRGDTLLKGDEMKEALVRYDAWNQTHGDVWRDASDRIDRAQILRGHRDLLRLQAEEDLLAGVNPMARIELERIELREMLALDPNPAFRQRLAALEQVGDSLADSVPLLSPDLIGPESDMRRYAVALGVDPGTPASYDIFYTDADFDYIDPGDIIDPDDFDGRWTAFEQRQSDALNDVVLANPQIPEEGGPAADAVRPGGLHGAAALHLDETRTRLDELMRRLLESAGLSDEQLAGVDQARRSDDGDGSMKMRQWYRWGILRIETADPARAAEMRATLANFDALAEREMLEALEYADWLQNFAGVPLSPNIERDALAADLWSEVEELLRPMTDFSGGVPNVDDPQWRMDRANAFALAKAKVEEGLDPASALLEWRAIQIEQGGPPERYDGLLEQVLSLLARHDPDFRKFPGAAADLRAQKLWQRNEMLYLGDLDAALDLQRQIDALGAAADPNLAESLERLDDLVDLESAEARRLLDSLGERVEPPAVAAPSPLQQDQWEAVRAGIPAESGDVAPLPVPGRETNAPRDAGFSDGPPLADGAAANLLGDAANTESPHLPADDALTPTEDGLISVVNPADNVSSPETIVAADSAADELAALVNLDTGQPRTQYPEAQQAFVRWVQETNRVQGAFDLTGVDESVQQMFRTWYVQSGGGGRLEGVDFDDLFKTLHAQLRRYDGQRRPPPGYASGADMATLNAWLALNQADMDLRQFARGFEGVLSRKTPPGFDLLEDLDDITKVRAALQWAADNTDDANEAVSLRSLVQMVDDYMYRTMTQAMARADAAAAAGEPNLPERLYAAYAAREIEARLGAYLGEAPRAAAEDDAYSGALRRALLDLRDGTADPRGRIDAQIQFLEAQIEGAGGDAARRLELQEQLDAHRRARATVDDALTKWSQPAAPLAAAPPDFDMDASWRQLFDDGGEGPQLAPHVPGSVADDLGGISQNYAARLGEDLGDVDPADPVAVRERIAELRGQALETLENPAGDALDADPGLANRYSNMLETMDRDTYRVFDQAGLANNTDGQAIRSRFPGLSTEFENFVQTTDPGGIGWTEAGVDPARIDAFEIWRQQSSTLDGVGSGQLGKFARFLRHQRRRYLSHLTKALAA